ncbi:glutamine amidotransferase of anthranilate synthase [alpha proteobacterium IMCC14465]|uniref:Glutamine amidotransferase of anthranilate synthase n=1 Tax=alpha proteobacterium IMCC14465 TaxID=1220535 RepID=J9DET4_9PROT|nr:glutamine amidotransferase of anthranilate synthase [alpha proteobacterium IMCC14465]
MILLIDNYDSFVHTLARYIGELGLDRAVLRHDAVDLETIEQLAPQAIIISPGPATPEKAGISIELVRHFRGKIPILGVCLGHQAIAVAYGGTVDRAPQPRHGVSDDIYHNHHALFDTLAMPFEAARYHALCVTRTPEGLTEIAHSLDEVVMAVANDADKVYGYQFHPESILTQNGHLLLSNFFTCAGIPHRRFTPDEMPEMSKAG